MDLLSEEGKIYGDLRVCYQKTLNSYSSAPKVENIQKINEALNSTEIHSNKANVENYSKTSFSSL